MMRPAFVCVLVTVAAAVAASAEDFPLTFRTIPAQEVMSFPGGSGTYGLMRSDKPAKLRKEPKAMSRHPLYGECRDASMGGALLFRLDESKGDGKGYDQLIADVNRNGDLTDDPVAKSIVLPSDRQGALPERLLFGPIQVPADRTVAGGRPVYFAQVYMLNREILSSGRRTPNLFFGQLMLKTGWYLDTTVKLDGVEQKVGVIDGDSNLRLGDVSKPQMVTNRAEKTWYFRSGAYLLVDADGSGKFENDVFQSEACPFGPVLYLGSKAYQVGLSPDYKSLHVEPWPGPLAQVTLKPRGDQVHSVTLAWERANGQWQLIKPAVTNGMVMVPPGNYRLYTCILLGKGSSGEQVMLSGMQRIPQRPVSVEVGQANTLACGGPLQIKVAAAGVEGSLAGSAGEDYSLPWARSGTPLRISASVRGAGGEIYSNFLLGPRFKSRPPKPSFSITEAGGKLVASGNLEYG